MMSSSSHRDDYLEKAFRLAYFIQGSRSEAVSVVTGALSKLEVAASAQVKRLYYSPSRRGPQRPATRSETHRTKVSLSELHLLQRLIYIESESYERAREEQSLGEGGPTVEALLIHYIKHLVRITLKRNSFYVTLATSRLLHNYSTAETMEIYSVTVQDPERVKDDYYYRSRKSRLIQETKERFGDLLTVCRGPRGEERFKTLDDPAAFVSLVQECLSQFSPWDTECSVPDEFDPLADELRSLSCSRKEEEDRVEINRIHAVLHPRCYARITRALKMELPELRLDIPYFSLKNGENDMNRPGRPSRRSAAQPLSADELKAIKSTLGEQSARRCTTHTGLLSIVVDGMERARLDLRRSGEVSFEVEEGDELVEVRAQDYGRETLLAMHLLSAAHGRESVLSSEIVLEGGQKLSFVTTPEVGSPGGAGQYRMTIAYKETRWLAAAHLIAGRAAQRLAEHSGYRLRPERALLSFALFGLALLLCAGAVLALLITSKRSGLLPVREEAEIKRPGATVRPRVNAPQLPPAVKMLSHGSSSAPNNAESQAVSEPEAGDNQKATLPEKIEQQDNKDTSRDGPRTSKRRRKP
ncbi:MAG TPA: hypothetical protein VF544_23075 [Pyrinomonadaceae bacterium]